MNLFTCKFLNTCKLHYPQQAKLQTAFWFILNLPPASFICSCIVRATARSCPHSLCHPALDRPFSYQISKIKIPALFHHLLYGGYSILTVMPSSFLWIFPFQSVSNLSEVWGAELYVAFKYRQGIALCKNKWYCSVFIPFQITLKNTFLVQLIMETELSFYCYFH